METLGIWLVRPNADLLGNHLSETLQGSVIRPWEHLGDSPKALFQGTFFQYDHWILVMTTGIAVRYLEGLPRDKHTDPAVVVLDEGARYAISLLSGHEGGANDLAVQVSNATGAFPIITTATETHKPLILGIGCRRGVSVEQIDEAIHMALNQSQRSLEDIRKIATVDLKGDEPALLEWCRGHQLPLHTIQRELLKNRPWVTKTSDWVMQNIGVAGVCEPCALLASDRGRLILEKTALNGVTVAIVDDPPAFAVNLA